MNGRGAVRPPAVDQQLAELRAAIDAAVVSGDAIGARARSASLWRRHPGGATAAFILGRAARLPPVQRDHRARVAILRSCTIEPVVPLLRAAALVCDIELDVTVGGFGTYAQELLDPNSPLYDEWDPDLVLLYLHGRDLLPELWGSFDPSDPPAMTAAVDRAHGHLASLVHAFRRLSRAHLVLHTLDTPPERVLGIADDTAPTGQGRLAAELATRLRRLADDTPGVHLIDHDRVVSETGRATWYDEDKWSAMRMPFRPPAMVALADEWVRHVAPLLGVSAKVVVVDLDDTLWGGVLGEDGPSGIRLTAGHRALQSTLRDLRTRGILLAIASKNNASDVDEVWTRPDMVLGADDFSTMRVGWGSKVDSLVGIAEELGVGLDALCFLDDSAVECDQVRRRLPQVAVIELDEPPSPDRHPLRRHPLLERLHLSAEDHGRAEMYAQERQRRAGLGANAAMGDLEEHLASLQTWVRVTRLRPDDVPRAAQLTRKTNQFNLTTRRYAEQDIVDLAERPDHVIYVARAGDRFGDHGTVALAVARTGPDAWELDTFLLSCRVIGRGVETALLASLVRLAARRGAPRVNGEFLPTAKNAPAARFFADHGFTPVDDEARWWSRPTIDPPVVVPHWIELDFEEDA